MGRHDKAEFSTDKAYLDNYIQALEAYRDEGIIKMTDDAIYSKVNEASNAAMCVSRIKGSALTNLNIESDDPVEIGVSFEKISNMLSGIPATSEIDITANWTDGSKMYLVVEVLEEDLRMEIPLINKDHVPKIPKQDPIKHQTRIIVSGSDLKKALSHLDKVYDKDEGAIILRTEGNEFVMESSDKVEGSVKKTFRQSGPASDGGMGEHQTKISWGFMKDIKKTIGKAEEVEIHIKDNNPIRLDLSLDDVGDAKIIYLIAPRLGAADQ